MKKRVLAFIFALCMCLALLPFGMQSADADVHTALTGTVYSAPTITKQPTNVTVAVGKTATFRVTASGASAYQWQYSKDNGKTWKNWSGMTSASAKVEATAKNNGNLYRCIVKSGSSSVTSKKVRLTVSGVKPRILTQPAAQKVAAGKSVTFKVAAGGTGKSYQWQISSDNGETWKNIKDKTSASLKVKGSEKNNGSLYRCVVKNSVGSTKSKGARLTVSGVKPAIVAQPAAKKAAVGLKAKFTVEACGTGMKYQWQYSDDAGKTWVKCTETGYNKATFSIKTTRAMDGRLYRCVVKNAQGSVKTSSAKLTVPQYFAILIGEDNYDGGDNDLEGCVNDMNAIAKTLGGLRSKYKIKKLPNSTKSEILSAIASYAKSSKSYDILYFTYSGHGLKVGNDTTVYPDHANHGALVPVDGNYITTSELADALSAFKGKVYVFLDSCFSGNAVRSENANDHLDAFNNDVIDVFSGYEFEDEENEAEVQTGTRYGELKQSKFTVLTAASYLQPSQEGVLNDENSTHCGVFSYFLVRGLGCNYTDGKYTGSMPADTDSNSKVTLSELYNYISSGVSSSGYSQSTQYYGKLSTVLFAR